MQITRNWRKCSLRYILFIQYQGYVMNINRGKAFMVCGMGGLYCLGFLCLHKLHHCCISLFRQLDIAIKSLCIFIAVCCDGVIHIGKFCKGTNNLIHIFLIIIKARQQSHIYGLRYKLSPLVELIQWI